MHHQPHNMLPYRRVVDDDNVNIPSIISSSLMDRIQPAGAFLTNTSSLRSPTTEKRSVPTMAPATKTPSWTINLKPQTNQHGYQVEDKCSRKTNMSFMSAMRRGLEKLSSYSDESDNDEDVDEESTTTYFQSSYNQYYAPTNNRIEMTQKVQASTFIDDDDLIFPMEM